MAGTYREVFLGRLGELERGEVLPSDMILRKVKGRSYLYRKEGGGLKFLCLAMQSQVEGMERRRMLKHEKRILKVLSLYQRLRGTK